jgi:hypothetical protein
MLPTRFQATPTFADQEWDCTRRRRRAIARAFQPAENTSYERREMHVPSLGEGDTILHDPHLLCFADSVSNQLGVLFRQPTIW